MAKMDNAQLDDDGTDCQRCGLTANWIWSNVSLDRQITALTGDNPEYKV
jgi:hypothetical protein